MASQPIFGVKCSKAWQDYLQEIAYEARLPNRQLVIAEGVRLLGDMLDVPAVDRIPDAPEHHSHVRVRLDRGRLNLDRLRTSTEQNA
jgi:hypothetical protein